MIKIYDWWTNLGVEYNNRYIQKANFYYDNIVNVGLSLNAADRTIATRITKYPAIILLSSVRETHRVDGSVLLKPQFLIVNDSKKDWLLAERQKNVYKPILYPITENLLSMLNRYSYKDFVKYDRDRISGALKEASLEAGISSLFNDSLDGIELREGTLVIRKTC